MQTACNSIKKAVSRIVSHQATVAALSAVGLSVIFFVVVVALILSSTEYKLEEHLDSYADIFSTDALPTNCHARYFPFFYSADGGAVSVTDHDITDWEELHTAAVRENKLTPAEYPPIYFAERAYFAERPCGYAFTPIDANRIVRLARSDDANVQLPRHTFELRFAQDKSDGTLYIMGHIMSSGRDMFADQFRLHLHYADRRSQSFTLDRKDGHLQWTPTNKESDDNQMLFRVAGRHGVEFSGTWWDTDSHERRNRYFEIRLDNIEMVMAIEFASEKLDERFRPQIRVGVLNPIPLNEELRTYQITKHLPRNSAYELFLIRKDKLPVSLARPLDPRDPDTLHQGDVAPWTDYMTRVLRMASGLYFFVVGHEPCASNFATVHSRAGTCFRFVRSGQDLFPYRLSMGKLLPEDPDGNLRLVVVEETPVARYRDFMLSILSVPLPVLLIMFLAYMNRRRRDALRSRNETLDSLRLAHSELDQRRSDLEQMNRALQSYAGIFIHEGRRRLDLLRDKVSNVLASANLQGSEQEAAIDELFVSVTARLRQSTSIFQYREIVRRKIAQHGHNRFSLNEAIEGILEDYDSEIAFLSPFNDAEGPELHGTGLPDPQKDDAPNLYFVQAMDNVIANAVRHRIRGTSVTVSLELDHTEAVIRVSNKGMTVPEDKLADVFDFGTRFSGARGQSENTELRDDAASGGHFGVGLFVTKQIIDGYQGTCHMENHKDGTGVIVTLRVPCA